MIIKAYINKNMFHLPMKKEALLRRVEQSSLRLFKREQREYMHKINPVTKVENNENIIVEKQNTNIFFLNLLLIVLNEKNRPIITPDYYNVEFIKSRLGEEIGKSLVGMTLSEIEHQVDLHFINQPKTEKQLIQEISSDSEVAISYLEHVQFSINWIRGAEKEIKIRERGVDL